MISPVIVALDFADADTAVGMLGRLDPARCAVKIGKELFTAAGPDVVRRCVASGYRVFLDLKYHDIPNTCAQACAAAARLGVWMLNVHASGGATMMAAAREAVAEAAAHDGRPAPLLVAVTVLTSLAADDLPSIGIQDPPSVQVLRLARLAQASGLDGVVCSAQEAGMLRSACGAGFKLVTPGIRPAGSAAGDQARIATPEHAMRAGADFLVIGRPVTAAPDPAAALASILESLESSAT